MDTGMPYLRPMGPNALQRGSHREEEAPPLPPALPAEPPALPQQEPDMEPPLWSVEETLDFPSIPETEDEDWPEEGEDAVPTERMPVPVCVPTLPPLPEKRRNTGWLIVLAAVLLGGAVGYAAHRLGWTALLKQGLDRVLDEIGELLAR